MRVRVKEKERGEREREREGERSVGEGADKLLYVGEVTYCCNFVAVPPCEASMSSCCPTGLMARNKVRERRLLNGGW